MRNRLTGVIVTVTVDAGWVYVDVLRANYISIQWPIDTEPGVAGLSWLPRSDQSLIKIDSLKVLETQ